MQRKTSDLIAQFLMKKNIKHVFGIIGAGNAHIFDSINNLGFTEIISVHHEQAAVMAMLAYFRACGQISAAIVTTGAGSTNAVTGVVSAWMDSIPGIIISGNEKAIHTKPENNLRIWGVQGYDSVAMVSKVTKYATRIMDSKETLYELEKSFYIAQSDRPGPCWLDIPMDIQAHKISSSTMKVFYPPEVQSFYSTQVIPNIHVAIDKLLTHLSSAKRPLFWLGHGIRLAKATTMIPTLLESSQIPALMTWQGMDMMASHHELVFGRAGIYGQRASNYILQSCDLLICIGTRMAYPQIGYDIHDLARNAKIVVVDIDKNELEKFSSRVDLPICADAKLFLSAFLKGIKGLKLSNYSEWLSQCNYYKKSYPIIGPEHNDTNGFINSYQFMNRLSSDIKFDQHIVTDMGTALLSGHQVLSLQSEQRLMTSTGLGEMGYALPAAIGVSFARNKGEVLCLNCDGGMMMNLQELQTIAHHQLPIKIIIFNNDGYLMIKHTQKNLFNNRYVCTNHASGVSCPNFSKLATAFNFNSYQIKTWIDYDAVIHDFIHSDGPSICEVFMDPEQPTLPKVGTFTKNDGSLTSSSLENMMPFLEEQLPLSYVEMLKK